MFRLTIVASVLFTAALATGGTADAHLGHHRPRASRGAHSSHHGHHGSVHLAAIHRSHTHVAEHRFAARHADRRRARSRIEAANRRGGAPPPVKAQAGAQTGGASYYGGGGHRTAAGGSVGVATCAHRTLPFGTRVLVTNLANARAAVLTVNDRGPFARGRIVDVSTAAARLLGMLHAGIAQVRVRVIGPG